MLGCHCNRTYCAVVVTQHNNSYVTYLIEYQIENNNEKENNKDQHEMVYCNHLGNIIL